MFILRERDCATTSLINLLKHHSPFVHSPDQRPVRKQTKKKKKKWRGQVEYIWNLK